jgi:hypothetical protein
MYTGHDPGMPYEKTTKNGSDFERCRDGNDIANNRRDMR